jgi:hypothetical protein
MNGSKSKMAPIRSDRERGQRNVRGTCRVSDMSSLGKGNRQASRSAPVNTRLQPAQDA